MIVNRISDLIVFKTLKNIKHGFLEIKNFDGNVLKFGNINEKLKARIEIKHPSLNYNLIRNGSIGLAESYMHGYFETDNLSNLIEITAKNIKLIYKFSGILDFSAINFLKNKIIKNTCKKKFHVSPFIEMNCTYFFKILKPTNKISLIIDQYDDEGKLLYASQDGNRVDLNNKNLILSYLLHPLMTFKIIAAIHFEAFKLWIKGIKFVKKKLNIKNNISIEN